MTGDPDGLLDGPTDGPGDPDALFSYLDGLGIPTTTVDHPPLFTVDEARSLRGDLPGGHCKNLLLRNKKGKLWLVVCREDRVLDLNDLGDRIGAGRVSFASPERLMANLGVIPGAVTPFAVINDQRCAVTVVLDKEMLSEAVLNYHPLVNDRTTAIAASDLLVFLESTGHIPLVVDLG